MSEISHESPVDKNEELQLKLEEGLTMARERMPILFDKLQRENMTLAEYFATKPELFEENKYIYGEEGARKFMADISNIESTNKEDFVEEVITILTPFFRQRVFDLETRARAEEIEQQHQAKFLKVGKLEANIHTSEHNFSLSDNREISSEDKVLEISWPDQGEKPLGLEDINNSFKEIVKLLEKDPDIKAVIGVSWMMSRKVTSSLGFEKFPEVKIDLEKVDSILQVANKARQDKDYQKGVRGEDVMLGAISREDFIRRYKN